MQLFNEIALLEQVAVVEDFSWDAGKPLDDQLGQAITQFDAARRALGIANRLTSPVDRAKHKQRIMSMLNRLRASMNRLTTAIDGEIKAMQQ